MLKKMGQRDGEFVLQILMTECQRTGSIFHGWRLVTLVLLASPARSAYVGIICHTMPTDDSVRKEWTAILNPYTVYNVFTKLFTRGLYIFLRGQTHNREHGIALNARTSESKKRKSIKKDTKHCLLCSIVKIQAWSPNVVIGLHKGQGFLYPGQELQGDKQRRFESFPGAAKCLCHLHQLGLQ